MISRFLLPLFALCLTSGPARGGELMVFAAASLTDALKEIGAQYGKAAGTTVRFNFAASSLLSRQIQEGARADLFFSADEEKVDQLEKKGLIKPGSRSSLLSNSLVITVEKRSAFRVASLTDLTNAKRIAIAEPSTVPAGIYAREALAEAGLWETLKARIVPTENVRGALAAVEAGNVDAAIVYKTDAAMSQKVWIALEIPSKTRISYPVAILKETKGPGEAERFLKFLKGAEAATIFERFGFSVLREGAAAGLAK